MFLDRGKDAHHMVVYHALGSTLCMFVPVIRELTVEFYRQLVRELKAPICYSDSAETLKKCLCKQLLLYPLYPMIFSTRT